MCACEIFKSLMISVVQKSRQVTVEMVYLSSSVSGMSAGRLKS